MKVFLVLALVIGFASSALGFTATEVVLIGSLNKPRCGCDEALCGTIGPQAGVSCVPLNEMTNCQLAYSLCASCEDCKAAGGTYCPYQDTTPGLLYKTSVCMFSGERPDICPILAQFAIGNPVFGPGVNHTHGCCSPDSCGKTCPRH